MRGAKAPRPHMTATRTKAESKVPLQATRRPVRAGATIPARAKKLLIIPCARAARWGKRSAFRA